MQLIRVRLVRHALATLTALCVVVGAGAGTASARSRRPFTQGDIAPSAAIVRQALADLHTDSSRAAAARYLSARAALAQKVAGAVGADPSVLDADWNASSEARLVAVFTALAQVGVPYRYATSDPGVGFDCSGLTSYAWSAAGVDLAHNSAAQIRAAGRVADGAVQPGDLAYYPGHVSLVVDDGIVVHAPHRGAPVEVRAMWVRRGLRLGNPIG